MMKKGIFGRFAVAAAVLLTMSSCLRDDLDDCPPPYNVRLVVVTDYEQENPAPSTRGAAEIDWYADQIDNVTVYVFDELTGEYVDAYEGPAYTMGEEYIVPFCLEEGQRYSFVAWTNTGDTYSAPQRSNLLTQRVLRDSLQVEINVPETRTFTEDLPHRHFGELDAAAVVADSVNVHKIVISPQTYRLNFIVRGLSAMTDEFGVTVTDRNQQHDFDSEFVPGNAPYYHIRTLTGGSTRAAGEIRASMILMQIGDDTQTSFDLKNVTDDESLYANDLLGAIETAYANYIGEGEGKYDDLTDMLANKYEYDIILNYSALGVTIEMRPWDYMPNNPGPLD